MIYEMRVYRCVPGGLPALLQRFEETTLGIWERLGIKQAGFFTTMIGESSNEWVTARAAHQEKHGEVVANIASQFLAPTAFSAV